MKKIMFLMLFLVMIPICISQDYYRAKNLIIELDVDSEFQIIPSSGDYQIGYVTANLYFFPRDGFNQDVLKLTTTPKAEEIDESITFRWDNPQAGKLAFNVNSEIMTNDKKVEVKSRVRFPITSLPNDVLPYTQPSATIDSDNMDIILLASELAAGEDDLYVVVHNIGAWVKKNIDYELSSLTTGISQTASWVLLTKKGVCDEITNLFIAMLRSLGIPARFISGVSYTELIEGNWGNHGWAEVYFPGYGWIPFDVTYGELGYLDPTHINLHAAIDAEESSTKYQWYGRNVDVVTKLLETKVRVMQIRGEAEPKIRLNTIAIKSEVGFGSYNLIETIVENLDDSYYSTELHISKPVEVSVLGDEERFVLLRPNERKKVYWDIKIPSSLRKTSVYTFPIAVWSSKNFSSYTSFKSSYLDKVYSAKEIEDILNQRQVEESKVYSRNVGLSCSISKDELYLNEYTLVACNLKNVGNVLLRNIRLCGGDSCEIFDLGISQMVYKEYKIYPSEIGSFEFVVRIDSPDVSKAEYIKYTVLDKPVVSIENLNYPDSVSYGDAFSVEFSLDKGSLSTPKEVFVELYQGSVPKGWRIDKLSAEQSFKVNFDSKGLGLNENDFEIRVRYKDNLGREYLETKSFKVILTNVPASEIPFVALRSIIMNLGYMDIKKIVYISGAVIIAFVIVIMYTVRAVEKKR